ncbi:putative E3 ubiquitin ligase PUB14 [Corchorus olitorius]|uniref:E3 ubiquitin ligase PUB14 n=1 Tax=Corchorus olitorius TaxID=93759 RepID=A0A1R3KXK9_9ROSI|nr:putative E3 ubiquitin ligase PUB14 [Corchorus olitorius]
MELNYLLKKEGFNWSWNQLSRKCWVCSRMRIHLTIVERKPAFGICKSEAGLVKTALLNASGVLPLLDGPDSFTSDCVTSSNNQQ